MSQLIIGLLPGFNNLFVTLFFCDQTVTEVLRDLIYGCLCICDQLWLACRHSHIGNGYGHSCSCGVLVTDRLNIIQSFCSLACTMNIDDFLKDLLTLLLAYVEINFQLQLIAWNGTVYEA